MMRGKIEGMSERVLSIFISTGAFSGNDGRNYSRWHGIFGYLALCAFLHYTISRAWHFSDPAPAGGMYRRNIATVILKSSSGDSPVGVWVCISPKLFHQYFVGLLADDFQDVLSLAGQIDDIFILGGGIGDDL